MAQNQLPGPCDLSAGPHCGMHVGASRLESVLSLLGHIAKAQHCKRTWSCTMLGCELHARCASSLRICATASRSPTSTNLTALRSPLQRLSASCTKLLAAPLEQQSQKC